MSRIIIIETDDDASALRALQEIGLTRVQSVDADATVAPVETKTAPIETTAAPDPAPTPAPTAARTHDDHGQPYDPEIHSTSRELVKDGSWKAQRGKADEAKAARAAFRASGGNVPAPVPAVEEQREAPVPTAPAPAPVAQAAPVPTDQARAGLPNAAPPLPAGAAPIVQRDAEVSQAQLEAKLVGMLNRGIIDGAGYSAILTRAGVQNLNDPASETSANAVIRMAVFTEACAIEPEAP